MGRKRKHSETVTAAPVKDSAPERPQRTLLGWKDKKEDAENSKPAYASVFRNKEKVLVTCSRRINFRYRHLMLNMVSLLPHCKKDSKVEAKSSRGATLNELIELKGSSSCLFFECRKHKDLYMWMVKSPGGPSVKFLVNAVHTMEELKLTGNHLKGSRPLLTFSSNFENDAHWKLLKEMLTQIFGIPEGHRKSKPYHDHVFVFSIVDDHIWFRDYIEEDPQIMKQKRGSKAELGEPVILRCQPYKIPLTELLLPHKISPVEFFRLWPSLPAVAEYTGTYMYEGSGFMATAAQQYGASPFLSGLKSLSSKPFHRVCSHIIRTVAGFQLCYAAKTWHGGFVGMMIFGASEVSRNMDLGDETTTMMCKFVVRASEASITKQIESDIQGWCDDLTDGGVEYMPEDEVKATAAEKLKISMERIALLKAAQPKKTSKIEEESENEEEEEGEEEDDDEEVKEKKEKEEGKDKEEKKKKEKEKGTFSKLTAEETEHMALQAAVLQEWHILCKDRKYTKVN